MLPSCIVLFLVGMKSEHQQNSTQQHASHLVTLLWGTSSCALAFFLASFQVHEKSILLALAPATLLAWDDNIFCDWFAVVAAWTMWPLLVVDRLQVAYTCNVIIFVVLVLQARPTNRAEHNILPWIDWCWKLLCKLSCVAMIVLHALETVVEVPPNLPDLFPVLWSVGGCALCCLAWAKTNVSLVAFYAGEGKQKAE